MLTSRSLLKLSLNHKISKIVSWSVVLLENIAYLFNTSFLQKPKEMMRMSHVRGTLIKNPPFSSWGWDPKRWISQKNPPFSRLLKKNCRQKICFITTKIYMDSFFFDINSFLLAKLFKTGCYFCSNSKACQFLQNQKCAGL